MSMNAAEMIKAIISHKGPVEVPVLTPNDVWHVIAQKADLINEIKRAGINPFVIVYVESFLVNGTPQSVMRLDTKSGMI